MHGRLVIVDAAHNGDSVAKFLEAAHMKFPSTKFTVVFGCGAEKEGLEAMVDAVRPFAGRVVCVEAGSLASRIDRCRPRSGASPLNCWRRASVRMRRLHRRSPPLYQIPRAPF